MLHFVIFSQRKGSVKPSLIFLFSEFLLVLHFQRTPISKIFLHIVNKELLGQTAHLPRLVWTSFVYIIF